MNASISIFSAGSRFPAPWSFRTTRSFASDLWIGNIGTSTEITHLAAGDTDEDGDDELVFIRHRDNDNQYLNIYNSPIVLDGEINPLIASDIWIGSIGSANEITHMALIR